MTEVITEMVMETVTIVVVAIICQYIVNQLKNLFKFEKGYYKDFINLKVLASIIVSLIICICYDVDMMALLGLTTVVPFVGRILTSVVVSAGSTTVHEMIKKINTVMKKGDK